jgi:DNA-binding MarR family transcriptional regulator
MVALLDRLEERGLAHRHRDPKDRRAHLVELTDEGRAVLARGRRIAAKLQAELFASLDDREREELTRLLSKVAEGLARDEPGH